ncbi:MAG: hypothetical protein ABJE47_19095 [bacterium]
MIVPITTAIPLAGYYRVVASVSMPDVPTTVPIQTQATVERWLLVNGNRTQLSTSFGRGNIPRGFVAMEGPFISTKGAARLPGAVISPPIQRKGGPFPTTAAELADSYDYWNIVIPVENSSPTTYTGFPYGSVVVNYYQDDGSGNGILFNTDYLGMDSNGGFQVPCTSMGPNTNTWYEMGISLGHPDAAVNPGLTYSGIGGGNGNWCGQILTATSPGTAYTPLQARLLKNLVLGIPLSRSRLGYSRGQISVYTHSGSGSYYTPSSDQLTIGDDDIAGLWGHFTAMHEYGHAVHKAALGGIPDTPDCSPHYFDDGHTLACALVEGFADFHSFVVNGPIVFSLTADYSKPCTYRPSPISSCSTYSSTAQGAYVEGAIASFMYHMIDTTNYSHDAVTYPVSYVAELMQSCAQGAVHADGIDSFIYCAEHNLDTSLWSTYWPKLGLDIPQSYTSRGVGGWYSQSATTPSGWSASNIRTLWKWDLYRQ